ncbi:hypothetical protein PVK06_037261 [Gossypium arboreum]|uniref:Reticulon-like protein n=1 Tax=Gossypium arboreum TaxID=29729 RepID=A0ABR0MWT9_GOSAR|nr:hypothetical protein PVK06_037261 [Gossypium arboreum]
MIHRLIPMTISHQKRRSNTRSFVSLGEKDPSPMFSSEANRLTFSYGGTKRHQPEPSGIAGIQPSPSSVSLVDAYSCITFLVVKCYCLHPEDIASGRDLKKFLSLIASLWVLSIVGSWCNFWTLFYIVFILLHTVLVLYEKYEGKVDPFAEKAMHEIKKQYAVFDTKFLRFRGDG